MEAPHVSGKEICFHPHVLTLYYLAVIYGTLTGMSVSRLGTQCGHRFAIYPCDHLLPFQFSCVVYGVMWYVLFDIFLAAIKQIPHSYSSFADEVVYLFAAQGCQAQIFRDEEIPNYSSGALPTAGLPW